MQTDLTQAFADRKVNAWIKSEKNPNVQVGADNHLILWCRCAYCHKVFANGYQARMRRIHITKAMVRFTSARSGKEIRIRTDYHLNHCKVYRVIQELEA